jgi:SAM-dependent methyltransferase
MTEARDVAGQARYDAVADWYDGWVGDAPGVICEEAPELLADRLVGERVLDVACGQGRVSRELGLRGATVVGVDLSVRLVAKARTAEAARPLGIDYVVADIAGASGWWDGRPFDGAVCEMALMDIGDLRGALAAVSRVVRPGGWFLMSLVHPCCPGRATGLSSWPPDRGYGAEGWWTSADHNPDGARIRVGAYHRTLSTYLNALTDAGLQLERTIEPPAEVPTLLVLACRRPEGDRGGT